MAAIVIGFVLLAACGGPTADPRSFVSRDRIDRVEVPLIFAEIPDLGAGGLLRVAGSNNGVVTWNTADGIGISLDQEILVSTRGLGFDLMSADVSGTRAALAGAGGEYALHHSYLDGTNQTLFRSFLCTMAPPVSEAIVIFERSYATERHDETCYGLGQSIENSYWVGNGVIWRSRQWIGAELGYVTIDRLVL